MEDESTSDTDQPQRGKLYHEQHQFPSDPDEESIENGFVPSSGKEDTEPPKPKDASWGTQPKELPQ